MPNYFARLRSLRLSSVAAAARSKIRSARKALTRFARPQSFSIPSTLASIPPRVARNLSLFRVHYAVLLWICLLVSLAPRHKPTMLFLMASSKIALCYEVVVRAIPSSWRLVHRLMDRRLAAVFFVLVLLVELEVTGAAWDLVVAVAAAAPVVAMHAVFFRGGEEGIVPDLEEAEAEEKKVDAELEAPGDV